AAKTVAANDDATTSEVTTAITDLASAIAGLEQITLDTSAIEHEIELAEQILANIDDYVASTVEGLQEKVDAAKAALENAAIQAEIDEATKTLREARLSARTKADTSALEALIAEVNAMDLSGYTADSRAVVQRALGDAEAAMSNEEVTQEEVNAALDALNAAVDGLVKTTADQPQTSEPSVDTPSGSTSNSSSTSVSGGIGALAAALVSSAGAAGFLHRRKRNKR
ncbi:MAG: hypothetical protein U0M47_04880, partial [Merdibacter sp.]|nr:hypothetical protein [Merdibacter sp.]